VLGLTANNLPDWPTLLEEYPFLREMEGCPQDPIWHAEGDVLIHEKMVCAELAQMEGFKALSPDDQVILMLAAIFHDCAKSLVTAMEDGRWVSPRHATAGARRLRFWWWTHGCPLGQEAREQVLNLVRYHATPVHFLGRPLPESIVVERSQMVRSDLLTLLAEADMRGRGWGGPGREDAIATCQLYADMAQGLGCRLAPWKFENDHARFEFGRAEKKDHRYQAYDDRKFTATIVAGLPGSGKSTFTNQQDQPVVTLDEIRRKMDVSPLGNQGAVIQKSYEQVRVHLRTGTPFVWDATNLTQVQRGGVIQIAQAYGARVHLHWFEADRKLILRRNRLRPDAKRVSETAIDRMADKIDFPSVLEAHGLAVH
jgi:predicted kinase